MEFKLLKEHLHYKIARKVRMWILFASVFLMGYACQPRGGGSDGTEKSVDSSVSLEVKEPAKPLVDYWEGYDFKDVEAIHDPNKAEQAFVDFIYLFPQFDQAAVTEGIQTMLNNARVNKEVFDFFVTQYDKYLYDPNSPMRNDQYYEPVLVYLVNSDMLSDQDKTVKATLLKLVRKNQPGSEAADFAFLQADGKRSTLHSLDKRFTLLFFYEPGCPHCEQAIAEMKNQETINRLIQDQVLTVLAVYPFGGHAVWKDYASQLPENWLNVFDDAEVIMKSGKYDLKATPTIFLLDSDKKVLLKDVDVQQLLAYLSVKVV